MNQNNNQTSQPQPKTERINHRGGRQIGLREGDYLWLSKKQAGLRLRTHPSSDEELEIIEVVKERDRA